MHFLHPNDGAMEPVDSAREAGTPAEGNTRLIGHSTLVELHATPETILPESKCSLLRRAIPDWQNCKTCHRRTRMIEM